MKTSKRRRPVQKSINASTVIIAFVAATPPTIAAISALVISLRTEVRVEGVQHATNSMKDALVAAARQLALVEGYAKGVAEEKIRKEGIEAGRAEGASDEKLRQQQTK